MFKNMKVSTRLAWAFGVVIVLLVLVSALGLNSLISLNRQVERLANNVTPQLILAGKWEAAVLQTARHMRNVFILPDPAAVKEELKSIHANKQERADILEQVKKMSNTDKGKALLQNVVEVRKQYVGSEDEFLKVAEAGAMDEAKKLLLEKARPAQLAYIESINKLIDNLSDEAKEMARQSATTYQSSVAFMVGLALLATLTACAVGYVVSRSLRLQSDYAASVATRIAQGDLSLTVDVTKSDGTSLLYAMSEMATNLRRLVSEVSAGAQTVSDTSAQIAQGNLDLSQRTEEQASTLEETASSMEELTSTVTQNAHSAKQASQLAVGASDVARKGGQVVGQVVSTMTGISDASRKISDIIGVIDGIAFQTNILALNAAVEAARAGEQGRGFAVVAAEVRNLAQRSAAAAKEIKTLIGDSVNKVEAGTRLVDAAGKTMEEIVTSVSKVSELIAEIAAASQEQSSGIEQVHTAITQMDQVVQQNASLVEEATAATESMKEQAASLLQTVSRFNLGGSDAAFAALRETAPAAVAAPAPVSHAMAPMPIKVRPSAKAPAAQLNAPFAPPGRGNGEWQEF